MSAFADAFLGIALFAALLLLSLALVLVAVRVARGPTLADRVLGLDTLTVVGVGFLTVLGIATGLTLAVDIAVALGLVGFLATVAFARFIAAHASARDTEGTDR